MHVFIKWYGFKCYASHDEYDYENFKILNENEYDAKAFPENMNMTLWFFKWKANEYANGIRIICGYLA